MPGGITDILKIIMFASRPHTALACGRSNVVAFFLAHEYKLKLDHSGIGKEQGRIILGDK